MYLKHIFHRIYIFIELEYLFGEYVAEEGDLVADRIFDRLFAAANDDVRRNAEAAKFANARLQSIIHI